MRALRTVIFVTAAALLTAASASAQDPPTKPAAPTPEAVALLKRVAEKCPSPAAAGVREVRCTVHCEALPSLQARVSMHWPHDGMPVAKVDGDAVPEPARGKLERIVWARLFAIVGFRDFWNPDRLEDSTVSAEPTADGFTVSLSGTKKAEVAAALWFDRADRVTAVTLRLGTTPAMRFRWTQIACRDRGTGWAPASLRCSVGDHELATEVAYHDAVKAFAMPRRVDVTRGTEEEAFLFHDVFLDGVRVDGTSLAETQAGRPRRVAESARKAFARHAATVGYPPPRDASCRVHARTRLGEFRFRCRWWDDLTCVATSDPDVPDTEEAAGFRAGFAKTGGNTVVPDALLFDGFDADAHVGGGVVLSPLDPGSPVRRIRLRFDDLGRASTAEQEFADGSKARVTMTYATHAGRSYVSEIATQSGEVTTTSRSERWLVDAFPLLPRRVTATTTEGEFVAEFTDWVVDGKPVPGTESKPAGPPK